MVLALYESGHEGAVIPVDNQGEVAFLKGFDIRVASNLAQVAAFVKDKHPCRLLWLLQQSVTPRPVQWYMNRYGGSVLPKGHWRLPRPESTAY